MTEERLVADVLAGWRKYDLAPGLGYEKVKDVVAWYGDGKAFYIRRKVGWSIITHWMASNTEKYFISVPYDGWKPDAK